MNAATVSRVDDIAARLEQRVLSAFWETASRTHDRLTRLSVLLEYTCLVLRRDDAWDPDTVRRAHATHRGIAQTITTDRTRCFGCGGTGQLYAHHIIEIQYGGSNAVRNQVPLCFDCHQYLHPWLTDDDRAPSDRRSTSFEAIGSIMARSVKDIVP